MLIKSDPTANLVSIDKGIFEYYFSFLCACDLSHAFWFLFIFWRWTL